jgi:phage tail tape-measure protein
MQTVADTAAMDTLANSMQESLTKNGASPELNKAMQEMAALLETKNLLNQMEGSIPPELAQALQNAELTPEQLKQLSESLKKCQCKSIDKMAKLCKSSMIDPSMLSKCKSCASDSEQALKDFKDGECKDGECAALAAMVCNIPGRGGTNRGRGDAPLTWTDGTDENGAGFKEEVIEPDAIAGIDKSRMVGISRGAPKVDDRPTAAEGGALTGTAAGGGEAHKQRVLPQHKQAVMRYFHRGE